MGEQWELAEASGKKSRGKEEKEREREAEREKEKERESRKWLASKVVWHKNIDNKERKTTRNVEDVVERDWALSTAQLLRFAVQ